MEGAGERDPTASTRVGFGVPLALIGPESHWKNGGKSLSRGPTVGTPPMADPVIDAIVNNALFIVLIILIILTIVTFLELRFFRSFMKRRQARADLPDSAHNALLTA